MWTSPKSVYGTQTMLRKDVDIEIMIDEIKLSRCEVYTYRGTN